jgi:hypothetical protein
MLCFSIESEALRVREGGLGPRFSLESKRGSGFR